ncbi:hypothetical protein [Teredinibacter purpureus]|uniref:hypothetical protein n=1 Tax=Teredinibacter purpureus TaxID=2731756 RepID=UPI0005F7AA9E|nr:hypothetical protein [Teredinibacter purpureus]
MTHTALTNNGASEKADSTSYSFIREKIIAIRKGKTVVANEEMLELIEMRCTASNLNLEVVSIPNPQQIGTQDAYLAGYISAPEIEQYRLNNGLECPQEVALLKKIAEVSGYTLTEAYSLREALPHGIKRVTALQETLAKWQWKASITQMARDIKALDLNTKDGLMRAIQIQLAEERRRAGIQYANKYYSEYPSTKTTELEKLEKSYEEDLSAPQMVCNEMIADAILNRDIQVLTKYFIEGLFKSCEKVFGMATGIKVARLSKANKKAALIGWGSTGGKCEEGSSEKVRMLTSKKDSGTDLATVKVIGSTAYAYIDTVPSFHRGVHEEILRNEGINPNDITWKFSEEELRMVKKHTH